MNFDNVTAALASNAKRRPNHPAIITAKATLTHAELETRVQRVAGGLLAEGLKAGEIVGLSMSDTAEHIIAIFAMMRLGVIVLPMDIRWTASEKQAAMDVFGPRALLTDAVGEVFAGVAVITIDDAWMARAMEKSPVCTWQTSEDSPLLLSLSSGTTGLPKGPMISHGLFMRRLLYEVITTGTSHADINMLATPIYFGGGRNITLQNILIGATVVLFPPPYSPEELVEKVNGCRVTNVFLVPTQLRRLLQLPERPGLLFPGLRMLVCSGAMLHAEEIIALRRRITPNIFNTYATTDGGTAAVLAASDIEGKPGSVGRPAYLADIEIVNDEHRPLSQTEVGRIRYRTLAVADSYYRNPEETKAAFRDGWFYSGDLGYFDDEGYLYVVGRSKDMIIRGGINIYPAEIEAVLAKHPKVVDVAVVPWAIGEMGEEIAALVLPNQKVDEAELLRHASDKLARYKIPRRIFLLSDMPRNEAGKVNKTKLIEMLPRSPDGRLKENGAA